MVKNKSGAKSRSRSEDTVEKEKVPSFHSRNLFDQSEHALAVKKKLQKTLKATVEELKEEEEERKREADRERKVGFYFYQQSFNFQVREELNFIEQQERKMREQKRVEEMRKIEIDRAITDARNRAEYQRIRRKSSDSDEPGA